MLDETRKILKLFKWVFMIKIYEDYNCKITDTTWKN